MTEPQRLVWYLPVPACTKVNNVMQQLTSVIYQTSEQHKDVSHARQTWSTVIQKRRCHSLNGDLHLMQTPHFGTQLVASHLGLKLTLIMRKRLELPFFIHLFDTLHSFKRKAKPITIDTHAAIDVDDDEVQIDHVLLFQRLIISGKRSGLCSDP